ncbi:hypothetical protein [Roseateles sp. P5_D6]
MANKKGNPTTRVMSYLVLAQSDYLAGRHLLRNDYLEQGAMLAATAAEKYLKAVIGVGGMDNSDHLSGTLYKLVQRCQPELYAAMDMDFLKFLEKAYRLRYASASAPGFSIVVNQYRTLFAIDMLIADIDQCFVVASGEKTPYRASVERADPRVLEENVAISPALLPALVRRPNRVLDYKVEDDHQTVYATYSTEGVNMAGPYLKRPDITLTKSTFSLSRG